MADKIAVIIWKRVYNVVTSQGKVHKSSDLQNKSKNQLDCLGLRLTECIKQIFWVKLEFFLFCSTKLVICNYFWQLNGMKRAQFQFEKKRKHLARYLNFDGKKDFQSQSFKVLSYISDLLSLPPQNKIKVQLSFA